MLENARIAVTGLGLVSPLGNELQEFHRALLEGRSGISAYTSPYDLGYKRNQAGTILDADVSGPDPCPIPSGLGRASRFAFAACQRALRLARLEQRSGCGLVLGTAMGESNQLEDHDVGSPMLRSAECTPYRSDAAICNDVSTSLGLGRPAHLIASTCASGNHAIDWASDILRSGRADAMLAVGVDTIGYLVMLGFNRLFLQDPEACRPFDLNRKGTILSEGAGALLLERLDTAQQRNARIWAEVAGCGLSCDADPRFKARVCDIDTLKMAAYGALREAGLRPCQVDYISAHGSGTKLNDARETRFIKSLMGTRAGVPMSSIKSMLGHAQAAASSFEAIASVLSLQHDVLYPTINYRNHDPECDLDCVPNEARHQRVDVIMSNAFGFGGNNSIVIFKRPDA